MNCKNSTYNNKTILMWQDSLMQHTFLYSFVYTVGGYQGYIVTSVGVYAGVYKLC